LVERVKRGANHIARYCQGVHLDTIELTSEREERIITFISNALDDRGRDSCDLFVRDG